MAKFISDSGPVFYMSGAWKTMESLLEMKRIIFSTKFFFHIWTLMADWRRAAELRPVAPSHGESWFTRKRAKTGRMEEMGEMGEMGGSSSFTPSPCPPPLMTSTEVQPSICILDPAMLKRFCRLLSCFPDDSLGPNWDSWKFPFTRHANERPSCGICIFNFRTLGDDPGCSATPQPGRDSFAPFSLRPLRPLRPLRFVKAAARWRQGSSRPPPSPLRPFPRIQLLHVFIFKDSFLASFPALRHRSHLHAAIRSESFHYSFGTSGSCRTRLSHLHTSVFRKPCMALLICILNSDRCAESYLAISS